MLKLRRAEGSSADNPDLATTKIRADAFLREMYRASLTQMVSALALVGEPAEARVVELGAAGGITKDVFPWVETTDVRPAEGVDRVVDGERLPYDDESLDGLFAKDALHHIPDPEAHFREAVRVLQPGARAVYLEPNWNRVSRAVFRHLHPEPFDGTVTSWDRVTRDPMDSNQALAYIVFERDLADFTRRFPTLRLVNTSLCNGLSFLASGGVHSRTPLPAAPLLALRGWEHAHPRLLERTALNRIIVLEKTAG